MTTIRTATNPSRLRTALCAGTIVATLPYLALKIAWVAGSGIGVHGDGMHSGTMIGANLATLGMDAVAAVLALGLARPWGRRIPGRLLVLPMFVATGLLAPIAFVAPVAAVVGAFTGGISSSSDPSQDFIEGWVFAVVYGGFGLQAIGLVGGFVLHARERWAPVFALRLRDLPAGPADGVRRLIVAAVAVLGLVPVAIQLSWAFGSHVLRPDDTRTAAQSLVLDSGYALLTVVGLVGMLALTWRRRDGRSARGALVAAWVGTGTSFGWGLFWLLASSVTTPLSKGADMRGLALVGGLLALVGAVLATVLALLVVEAVGASDDRARRSGMIRA
ncbi:hypothetical protein [Kitasatospora sp. CB01950]|uniref:hypothetical protein n=1 Tax=Kitasatospora sp. CB01950 TaxID=1703930 RepID=UPI00093D9A58|nr:hypothetical protein [Kitasatospora sp. CB01950]